MEKKKTFREILLDSLTDKEKDVLAMRFGVDEYEAVATVTRGRIREIEKRALEKLQARSKSMRTSEPVLDDD